MPKAKTKRVPAALHSELTEYASLLRALRTEATLDLSAHLSKPKRLNLHEEDDADLSSDDEETYAQIAESKSLASSQKGDEAESGLEDTFKATSPPVSSSLGDIDLVLDVDDVEMVKPMAENRGKKRRRPLSSPADRDTWTRWPLLPGDVHSPEWTISEEVAYIARGIRGVVENMWIPQTSEQEGSEDVDVDPPVDDDDDNSPEDDGVEQSGTMSQQHEDANQANQSVEGVSDDIEDDSDEDETDIFQQALTASAEHHLRTILTLCAVSIPRVALSMRSRLAPMDWVGVLNAVAVEGVISPSALLRVRARLEAIYGKHTDTASSIRVQKDVAGKKQMSTSHQTQVSSVGPESFDFSSFPATALSTVQTARERLNNLYQERRDEGDGDIFTFHGPKVSEPEKPKRKHRKKMKTSLEPTEDT